MKKFILLFILTIYYTSSAQTPIYVDDQVSSIQVTNLTTGENNLDFRGYSVINLNVKAGGANFGYTPNPSQSPKVNIKLFVRKNGDSPIMIASEYNVPVITSLGGLYSSAYKTFNVSLNLYDYQNGGVMYCIVENAYGATYSFLSREHEITNCPYVQPPTNITATPYSYGYTINFSPQGGCLMEYVDLVTGNSGTTTIASSNAQGGSNFFYYVPQSNAFKFRLKFYSSSCALFSNWVTVDPNGCSQNDYPTNLTVYSQCGSSSLPSVCGGVIQWTKPANTTAYQIEYLIFNSTGQSYTGTLTSTSSSKTLNQYTSSSNGPWMIKVRAKAQCVNGTWSDFSPWSQNFAWGN
ncbi:hypothetical protein GCM10007424_20590 [Flavobacterium suaedae]|uniref:Fibronectin type-III domain-containing protein n=1 Tax=Flavobacterium suaedae TaxID=1767027 RepID=A0ABQ1JWH9_9FLAO|nr:hypothetical protein [Flavobacterium suaedae]GGB80359.1 hypothetical protein GCM10007424_20590 [Flavobacterium suaedae]